MQIIIGRDAKTSQLNVIIGQQTLRLGAPGSVPRPSRANTAASR